MTYSAASLFSSFESLRTRDWAASLSDLISPVSPGRGGHWSPIAPGIRLTAASAPRAGATATWQPPPETGGDVTPGQSGSPQPAWPSMGTKADAAAGSAPLPWPSDSTLTGSPGLGSSAALAASESLATALTQIPSTHDLLQASTGGPCHCPVCSQMAVDNSTQAAAAVAAARALPATTAGALAASTFGSLNLADTFLLHSNPTATKRIFLDFDGYESASSRWENGGALKLRPFYSSFTDSVKLEIQRIWQRVTEDYAPFNVDVTTQDPGADRLIKSGGSDTEWGIRMVFTDNYNLATGAAITNAGGGGTAYLNSFNWSDGTPALGFNRGEYAAAETASHEVGHTLNLQHDGTSTNAYYSGHGSGETSWGAIMGAPFIGAAENVTTWSKGEYYAANNTEDDLSIITTRNGFGYRSDDHGNSATSATVLTGTSFTKLGTISTTLDNDWFRFETGTGAVSLSLVNANQAWVASGGADYNAQTYTSTVLSSRGPNLDLEGRLYDASGALLAISNPVGQLTASFDVNLSAGIYYLSVNGVGTGNPFSSTPTGYTDYASLGQYLLTGTVTEPIGLVITPSGDPVTSESGGSVSFAVRLSKQPSAAVTVQVSSTQTGEGTVNVATLSFDSGNWSSAQTIVVTGVDDALVDGTVNYALVLNTSTSAATEYAALPATSVAISNLDNDQPLLTLQSAAPAGSLSVLEGADASQAFTLSLSTASLTSVSVLVSTANGTALAGSDYTALSQTVVFNPGETQKIVQVGLLNDAVSESDETFDLVLSAPQNAILSAPSRLSVTISDTLSSAVTTTLPSGVENLTLTGANPIDGTGNSGANIMTGNSGANRLRGGGGRDVITGLGGNDSFDLSGLASAANATTVTDFKAGGDADLLLLSASLTSFAGSATPAVQEITSLDNSRLTLDTNTSTGSDLFVVTPAMTESDVDLGASTNGSALLDGLYSASGSVRLSTSTLGGKGYIASYDNGHAYLYFFNAGTDSSLVASEIQRIGILNSVGLNTLNATDIQMI